MLALIAHDSQKKRLTQLAAEEEHQRRTRVPRRHQDHRRSPRRGAGLHLAVGTVPEAGHRGVATSRSRRGSLKRKVGGVIFLRDVSQTAIRIEADIDATITGSPRSYGVPRCRAAQRRRK